MLWRLVWRNVHRRPWQTGLTIFVVGSCTAALVICLMIVRGIEQGARNAVDNLGADVLVIPAAAQLEPGQVLFTGAPANIYMPGDVVEEIVKIPGVEAVSPQFFSQTLNESCCSLPEEYRLVGYDSSTDFLVKRLLAQGVKRELNPREVVVGGAVPAFLGDRVLILGTAFDVAGYLKPMGGGIDRTIFISMDTARQLAGASPYLQELWAEFGDPSHLVSAVLIKTAPGTSPERVAKVIGKIEGVRATAAAKMFINLKEQLLVFQALAWVLAFITVGITLASLLSRYSSLVIERQEEIGLLRALGTGRRQVFLLVMAETVLSGLIAAVAGALLGWGLVYYLKGLIEKHSSFPFLFPPLPQLIMILTIISAGVVLISIAAALWPARVSAKMDPVIALTEGELK